MQSMLNSLQNGRCSFIFRTLLADVTTPTISTKDHFLYFSQLSPHFSTWLFNKIILKIHTNSPFHHIATFFHLAIYAYNHPSNIHQKYFICFSQLSNSGCVKGQRSCGVLWGFLISPFFLKVWTVIITLTVTGSLLLSVIKWLYCT